MINKPFVVQQCGREETEIHAVNVYVYVCIYACMYICICMYTGSVNRRTASLLVCITYAGVNDRA